MWPYNSGLKNVSLHADIVLRKKFHVSGYMWAPSVTAVGDFVGETYAANCIEDIGDFLEKFMLQTVLKI
jgi:hypothetical protein